MQSGLKSVLYIGKSEEFFKTLSELSLKTLKDNYNLHTTKDYSIIESYLIYEPNIIFIDFRDQIIEDNFFEEILFLKSINRFKQCILAFLIEDSSTKKEEITKLLNVGFHLGHINGSEVVPFILDSLSITFEEKYSLENFVKVQNLKIKLELSSPSMITKFEEDKFEIETDLEPRTQKMTFKFKLPFFPEFEKEEFEIQEQFNKSTFTNHIERYEMTFPYKGPWQQKEESYLTKDEVKNYIDSKEDEFKFKAGNIKVFSGNKALVPFLYLHTLTTPFFIEYNETLGEEFANEIKYKFTPLVFLDLCEKFEDTPIYNDMETLSHVINGFKQTQSVKPIVIVTNTYTTSTALQKVYHYENIIAVKSPLTEEVIKLFTSSYVDKNLNSILRERYFRPGSIDGHINIKQDITLTSLAENEVTFISKNELAIYSSYFFELPIEFYITIIPADKFLAAPESSFHYQAIIHSTNENSMQILRQFINQILHHPPTELTRMNVDKILSHKIENNENEIFPLKKVESTISEKGKVINFQKKKNHDKSKLF